MHVMHRVFSESSQSITSHKHTDKEVGVLLAMSGGYTEHVKRCATYACRVATIEVVCLPRVDTPVNCRPNAHAMSQLQAV